MKFQHLPDGARFEYEGRHYTKISPLVAAEEGGGQRMIPRYAVLRPLAGDWPKQPEHAEGQADMAKVLAAFAEFERTTLRLLAATGDAAPPTLQAELEAAGRVFRNKIKQHS
ncbi:MAG: hypothetical protein P4L77_01080 [Sulfuriferula sp.]|nr:hypothetical protein [Sulfuriferula sp.]